MKFQNVKIRTVDDWFRQAPPMGGEKQWKDGRSAMELAKYVLGDNSSNPQTEGDKENFPANLKAVIQDLAPDTSCVQWTPEFVTNFDPQKYGCGEGRHHDLAIFADKLFIGVEAKADEPFDKPLSEWLKAGSGKGAEENRCKRANAMCQLIFGKDADSYNHLHYQLLSALTGVLLEAENCRATKAALVILTFKKAGKDDNGKPFYSDTKIQNNKDSLQKFLDDVHFDKVSHKIITYSGIPEVFVYDYTIDV